FLSEISSGTPIVDFPKPPGIVQARVDAFSGMLPGPYTSQTVNEYFIAGTAPTTVDNTKVSLDIDTATGLLWQDGCTGPKQTVGPFLDLSQIEARFPTWQQSDNSWVTRAMKGTGQAGGPNRARTTYFYDPSYHPYGASWGAPFAPTATCTPTGLPPSIGPCDPLLGPCPTPCDPLLGPCSTPSPSVASVVVANVRCQSLDLASANLTANGLAIGNVTPTDPGPNWIVASQTPLAGAIVAPGTSVDLQLADPAKTSGCP
ncbi:MAG: PASTA domain-containing protein, partial [Acidimicrobiales bacterium]